MKKGGSQRNPAKAAKVVKSLISNDLNKSAAARELGVSPQAIQKQVNENPLVRTALEDYLQVLQEAGVDDKKSARVISEAMDAERTVSVEDNTEDSVGPKGQQHYTNITEPDHMARLKANDQYLKIKRLLSDKSNGSETPVGGQHLHFHLGDAQTNEIVTEIRNQLTTLGGGKPPVPRRNPRKGGK